MGIFLLPLMDGTVILQDALKPAELIRTIRRERVSLLVAVPRTLQSLKEKIERDQEEVNGLEEFRRRVQIAEGKNFFSRWWIFPLVPRQLCLAFWAFICARAAPHPVAATSI